MNLLTFVDSLKVARVHNLACVPYGIFNKSKQHKNNGGTKMKTVNEVIEALETNGNMVADYDDLREVASFESASGVMLNLKFIRLNENGADLLEEDTTALNFEIRKHPIYRTLENPDAQTLYDKIYSMMRKR